VGGAEGDAELAEALAEKRESARNKDAKGTKAQKAKALAALREVSIWQHVHALDMLDCTWYLILFFRFDTGTQEGH
jgi:hypothetical protein